jgi:hypothetical protein
MAKLTPTSLELTFRPYNAGTYQFGIAQCSATGTGDDRKLTQLDKLGWMGDADNPSKVRDSTTSNLLLEKSLRLLLSLAPSPLAVELLPNLIS